ncbi:MAG TPA: tRNA pseudouridine(13) synthase TruD [Arenimonas sp.]|nr:tRNA pseudouridine(13) synthase TruD [Arenimonas sp.]
MNLPRALTSAPVTGRIRSVPEDFIVEELPAFEASGEGEHLLLTIQKRGMNTAFCAQQIARWAGIDERDVSYAGMKDRHALTTQRFSVRLPKKISPDVSALNTEECTVLDTTWHNKKLARGALAGNRFQLILREMVADKLELEKSLQIIKKQGVPNYFGEQRFGQEQANVGKALGMFEGRRIDRAKRSIYLSAARSYVFNHLLANRVEQGNWNQALPGEVWMLEGTKSIFGPESLTDELSQRLDDLDIHPTGPMWGAGDLRSQEKVLEIEAKLATQFAEICIGLAKSDLRQERRALRLVPKNLTWNFIADDVLQLSFELPPGAYATSILAELGSFE